MSKIHRVAVAACLALMPSVVSAQETEQPAPPAPPAEGTESAEAPPTSIRTLLVVDDPDGGKMTRKLTLSASMLYASLANKADALGVYVDSTEPLRFAPKSLAKGGTFTAIRQAMGSLPDAKPADYAAVLDFARRAFATRSPGQRDAVVVLAHSPRDGTAKPKLPKGIGQAFRAAGVRVYMVGFGAKTNPADYAPVVEATDGKGYKVLRGAELKKAFSGIFTHLHETEALPVTGNEVEMDDSVAAATIVLPKKKRGDRNQLVTPGDRVLSARVKYPGVKWTSFEEYDLVRIEDPEAGTWRVRQPSKLGGIVGHVNQSDLRLRVKVGPRSPMVGDITIVEAWLEKDGRIIDSYAQLKHLVMEAEVRDPAGRSKPSRLERKEGGVFRVELGNILQGYHEVTLSAFSPNVQRERRMTYLVHPSCFQGKMAADTGAVSVEMSNSCPRFAELYARLVTKDSDGKAIGALNFRRKGMTLSAMAPRPSLGQSFVHDIVIEARTMDGHTVKSSAGGPFDDTTRDPTLADYLKAIGERLALLNIPFVVGLIGVVVVRQARRGAAGPSVSDKDEEEDKR